MACLSLVTCQVPQCSDEPSPALNHWTSTARLRTRGPSSAPATPSGYLTNEPHPTLPSYSCTYDIRDFPMPESLSFQQPHKLADTDSNMHVSFHHGSRHVIKQLGKTGRVDFLCAVEVRKKQEDGQKKKETNRFMHCPCKTVSLGKL